MKRILMIHTGGTIGMFPTEHGYAPSKEGFHRVLASIPELTSRAVPAWDLVDMDPLLDSSNISVNEWNKIGSLIAEKYDDYDGFVVLHGTDTMAYTASALSFMLRNNAKPVILTGSQIPLCEIRNDARDNLLSILEHREHGLRTFRHRSLHSDLSLLAYQNLNRTNTGLNRDLLRCRIAERQQTDHPCQTTHRHPPVS